MKHTTLTEDDLQRVKHIQFRKQKESCRINKYIDRKRICRLIYRVMFNMFL